MLSIHAAPRAVDGSPPNMRADLDVAEYHAEAGHGRMERVREQLRLAAQWRPVGQSEAYWLLQAADHFESALACFVFAAAEREKEARRQ